MKKNHSVMLVMKILILYSEARMIAGLPIDNPTEISQLICDVISR